MKRLVDILSEAYGLVVDDASLAAAILVWVAVVGLARAVAKVPPAAGAVALALGLAVILVENVLRRARRP